MNVKTAIDETMTLVHQIAKKGVAGEIEVSVLFMHPSLGYQHIHEMYDRIRIEPMSEGKLNRWLGWMQAAIVSWGVATVEDMKTINKRHADNE